jgi:site-specific DNA-methyltransferase (adenine-specific)
MHTTHKIIIGDSRTMAEITDQSIHLIITSPPYWQLKDYGNNKQIGFNNNYEQYVNNLNLVWNECHRVLHDGCRLCINIGDQYARSVYYGRYKVIPIRTEIIKFCEIIGFDYMGAIIWQKVTTTNTTGGASVMGSFPFPRNGIIRIDYEFILIFKKRGNPPKVSNEIKAQSKLTHDEWHRYFSGHWNFPGEKQQGHLAMFPEELPKRLIKMFSFIGETVLDPFLGSGTTSLAAEKLSRSSIGYEINKNFINIIRKKLNSTHTSKAILVDIINQSNIQRDFKRKLMQLPYVFKDHNHLNKQINPKTSNYGSIIDIQQKKQDEYFKVCKIISPVEILLNNDKKVRLLGIKIKPDKREEAVKFLEAKTLNKKVFLKFDNQKYDENNVTLCYLYLSNKTFINAHLLKNQLVYVDTSFDFKYRDSFLAKLQI